MRELAETITSPIRVEPLNTSTALIARKSRAIREIGRFAAICSTSSGSTAVALDADRSRGRSTAQLRPSPARSRASAGAACCRAPGMPLSPTKYVLKSATTRLYASAWLSLFGGRNSGRARHAVQHRAISQLLGHPPAGARHPERMPAGRENLLAAERQLDDRARRPHRSANHRLVRQLARVHILREHEIAKRKRLDRLLAGLRPDERALHETRRIDADRIIRSTVVPIVGSRIVSVLDGMVVGVVFIVVLPPVPPLLRRAEILAGGRGQRRHDTGIAAFDRLILTGYLRFDGRSARPNSP